MRWGARLFNLTLVLLVTAEGWYCFEAQVHTSAHLLLGESIIALAALPALRWARRGRATLPVFEALLLTSINTYALPLLNGHSDLVRYTDSEISWAALGVIVFQLFAIVTYFMVSGQPSPRRFWREDVIGQGLSRWLGYGIGLNTAYLFISTFCDIIPSSIASLVRAIFFGLGIICMFVTSRRLGEGKLQPGERVYFLFNLAIQCVFMMATLFLVTTVSMLLLTLAGYVSASGRVPILITGLCLVLLSVLHNGKAAMRDKYWEPEKITPRPLELPAFYSEWIGHGLNNEEGSGEQKKLTSKLIDRTSLFHMMCLVVSITPTRQPFLYGETYSDIPAQFVPRFFWPDKPLGHVSTSRLSVYYGLQSDEDTLKTTIGFGMLCEAYANFGFYGLAVLGVLLGYFFKKIQSLAEGCLTFSYGGLLLILLLAWSFQVEFTLSIWLASLYQAAFAVLGIPFLVRQFLGQ